MAPGEGGAGGVPSAGVLGDQVSLVVGDSNAGGDPASRVVGVPGGPGEVVPSSPGRDALVVPGGGPGCASAAMNEQIVPGV